MRIACTPPSNAERPLISATVIDVIVTFFLCIWAIDYNTPPSITQMASTTTKPVHSLIIDAGPIIKNEPPISTLISHAEVIYTIPAVVDEIRDAATRARVQSTLLPFLKLRQPRPASVKVIADFARRTGDAEVLSKPDIQLMALAYELECERNHGDWRLRSVPGQKKINGAPPASLKEGLPAPAEVEEEKKGEKVEDVPQEPKVIPETRGAWGTIIPARVVESEVPMLEQKLEETHISETVAPDLSQPEDSGAEVEANSDAQASQTVEEVVDVEELTDDSDAEGWITPSNLKKHQEKDANTTSTPTDKVPSTMQVALITTDYAMQNVLLRINLNLLSPSLQTIRQLKTWVLRCHACFSITKDMAKQFCPRCGQPALIRTSCSTDKDGNFKVHLKKNMQYNTRGNVYSIPKLVSGTSHGRISNGGGKGGWGQELILAEDQKEYVRAMTVNKRQKEKDLMDEDYLPSILTGDRGRAGGRPKIGAGRNVNARRKK